MIRFLPIAFRNVFRNTRRTGMTLLVVTCGTVALVLTGGFVVYNFEGLRETTIRNGVGHLQIYTNQYLDQGEDRPLEHGIGRYQELQRWLEGQPHVVATAGEVGLMGLISNGEKSETFIGRGVDPSRETAMGFSANLRSGANLTDAAGEAEALLGTELATSLKAKVGDVLTLLSTTSDGALNAIDVRVVGLFATGIKDYDARAVKVGLGAAQRLLATDRVSKIVVRLDETRWTEAVAEKVAAGLPPTAGLRVKQWRDLATFYQQVVTLYTAIFYFMGLIIVALVILSSSNTMMMAVLERMREIGTLMAIGTRRRQLVTIFVVEGALIGAIGALAGLAVSAGLIRLINGAGIMMPPPPSFSTGIPLKVFFVPAHFVVIALVMVITLTVASVAPALRGARLKIVDALGHV
jgi:putative ABC transport system permease protein